MAAVFLFLTSTETAKTGGNMHRFKHLWRVCEADKGTTSGEGNGKPGDATGTNSGDQPTPETQTFTKDQVEALVKERLDRAERKAAEKAAKDREAAEAAGLAEQQKFKELADKHAAKVAELEPQLTTVTEKAERYEKALTGYLATLRKTVPANLLTLLDKLDVVDQLEWIGANADKVSAPTVQGVPPTPKPNGNQTEADREKARSSQANFYKGKF